MTDRPILFSGPMVRALLAGTKTQTRRVIKDQSLYRDTPEQTREIVGETAEVWTGFMGWQFMSTALANRGMCGKGCLPAYAVGDRLYVREAWKTHAAYDDIPPAAMGGDEAILYEADGAHQTWGYPAISKIGRFRQGMHMPRWASRLTLTVTDVRVQRLQDISERDAVAEGIEQHGRFYSAPKADWDDAFVDAVSAYRFLWDGLNADRGFGWDVNPWVVAVTFTVQRRNIDQVPT